jgi:hypothetical protein
MSEYDLVQDVNVGQRPKETKEPSSESHDATGVANAIAHGRPETLGPRGAMHVQRAAGNAAMGSLVQRQSEEESPVHQVIKGGGSSLDSGVRSQMEGSLGYDFSGVRVHTGPDAAKAATSVQAQAFTVGNDVVFNEGKYDPSSDTGKRTLAHELTHVVQQSQGSVPGESRAGGIKVSDPGDWAEQQAEATADSVMSGDHHAGDGHDHGGAAGGSSVQTLPLQRAAGEDELQTLPDPSIQRQEEEGPEEEAQEAPVSTLQDPSIQREEEAEQEGEE